MKKYLAFMVVYYLTPCTVTVKWLEEFLGFWKAYLVGVGFWGTVTFIYLKFINTKK